MKNKALNRIKFLIKNKGLTIKSIEKATGYTHDNMMKLCAGRSGLNEENMRKLSEVLNCYPSELLPLEWQKPALQEIDRQILSDSIREAQKSNIDNEEFLDLVPIYYNKKVREINSLSKNNNNLKINLKNN